MTQIKEMLTLQNQLNDHTNGTDWRSGLTEDNRDISWSRCIYMEAAEAIDSFNWKHWKAIDSEHDWQNAEVEVVDIWHFLISDSMAQNKSQFIENIEFLNKKETKDHLAVISILEQIMIESIAATQGSILNIEKTSNLFVMLLSEIGLSSDDLYIKYVVKNQLNSFRQNNGYKDGSYIKIWGMVEDNVIALSIMTDNPEFTPSQLYKELERKYNKLKQPTTEEDR